MALGKRKQEQQSAWIATTELPKSPGHSFCQKLNQLLAEAGFDGWLEALCAPSYAAKMGRGSIPPGVYFRMILVGYFEGISSQRGILRWLGHVVLLGHSPRQCPAANRCRRPRCVGN